MLRSMYRNYNTYKIEALTKELQCAICLNEIDDCGMTKCGHVFCKVY